MTETELKAYARTLIKEREGEDVITPAEHLAVLDAVISELFSRYSAATATGGAVPPHKSITSNDLTEVVDGDETKYYYDFNHGLNCRLARIEVTNENGEDLNNESYSSKRIDNYNQRITFYDDIPAGEEYLLVASVKLASVVEAQVVYLSYINRSFDTWLGSNPQMTVPGFTPKKDSDTPLGDNFMITEYADSGSSAARFYAAAGHGHASGDKLYFEFEESLQDGKLYNVVITYTSVNQSNTRFIFGTENNLVNPDIELGGIGFVYEATEDGLMHFGIEVIDETALTDVRVASLSVEQLNI